MASNITFDQSNQKVRDQTNIGEISLDSASTPAELSEFITHLTKQIKSSSAIPEIERAEAVRTVEAAKGVEPSPANAPLKTELEKVASTLTNLDGATTKVLSIAASLTKLAGWVAGVV